jgi:predicted cupin superfamily sugar epimerase
MSSEEIIQKFELEAHPEGGFYKRTYVAENNSFSSIIFY